MQGQRLRVGVLFGGRSAEHEVSIVSAQSVIAALDKKKYEVIPIGISKEGRWLAGDKVVTLLKSGARIPPALAQMLPADPTVRSLVSLTPIKTGRLGKTPDVIIPVLHGTFGEDGTVQGLLELAGIPYVGAGVLGSAVGMDKVAQKLIYQAHGILTPKFEYFTAGQFKSSSQYILRRIKKLGLPVFIKPVNQGSSVGISKVKQGSELKKAIQLALRYDRRVIVEKSV
ncbi:MAG: D-alanine--D-alanine ligase A, partial [Candidatus Veblenbacteria bacterium]|nr:D-alanine--D-alanine ligase A [Candidatus Veblenbacteria bacterium]